jgi:hypothetical protein
MATGDAPDGGSVRGGRDISGDEVVLSCSRLGVAPNSQRDKILVVHCHELKSAHLRFDLSLL